MNTKNILFVLIIFGFFASCKKDYYGAQPAVAITGTVSFSATIVPIFTSSCSVSGCHSGSSPADGLDLTAGNAYQSLFGTGFVDTTLAATSNTLYVQVNTGAMPKGLAKLSPLQIGNILAWIKQGAKNN